MFSKRKNISIEYWTRIPELDSIEEIKPQPYKNYIPEWWKNMPNKTINNSGTAKICPSFSDVFSSAYVLPMWCDTLFKIDSGKVYWETPSKKFEWEHHEDDQFLNHSTYWFRQTVKNIMKPSCPWFVKTPPGYSIYQLPLFYDFNEDFITFPGIIHTDVYHQINPQIALFSNKKEMIIKRGTPLAIHFPFKRSKLKLDVRTQTEKDKSERAKGDLLFETKFFGGYKIRTKGFLNNV